MRALACAATARAESVASTAATIAGLAATTFALSPRLGAVRLLDDLAHALAAQAGHAGDRCHVGSLGVSLADRGVQLREPA
jgi:hypothetical protein